MLYSPRIFGGSLDEVLSHLAFAFEMNFIPEGLYKQLADEGEEIDKMLNGYISHLKKSKQGASEPGANSHVREESSSYTIAPEDELVPPKSTTL
ncbi:MAG TPA: four helix bundle protein [Anaerolineales bacterium]|nr:four helix bundle protein [Anaerolineales bacterium]